MKSYEKLTCDCMRFHKCKLSTLVRENLSKNSTKESSMKISTEVGKCSRMANDQPQITNCTQITKIKSVVNLKKIKENSQLYALKKDRDKRWKRWCGNEDERFYHSKQATLPLVCRLASHPAEDECNRPQGQKDSSWSP